MELFIVREYWDYSCCRIRGIFDELERAGKLRKELQEKDPLYRSNYAIEVVPLNEILD